MHTQEMYQDTNFMSKNKNKPIVEAIRDYFMNCPLLRNGALHIDFLDGTTLSYSINTEANASAVIKRYTDGGKLIQYPFTFLSSEINSEDVIDHINACGFYEKLEDWINEQNKNRNLPEIEGIQSLEVLTPGYLWQEETGLAVYQIQCRITYYKEMN